MKYLYFFLVLISWGNPACASSEKMLARSLASNEVNQGELLTPEKIVCTIRLQLIGTDANGNKIEPATTPINFSITKIATDAATFYSGKVTLIEGSQLQVKIEIVKPWSQKTALFTWLKDSDVISAANSTTLRESELTASAQIFSPFIASAATKLNTLNPGEFEPGLIYSLDGKQLGNNVSPFLATIRVTCK